MLSFCREGGRAAGTNGRRAPELRFSGRRDTWRWRPGAGPRDDGLNVRQRILTRYAHQGFDAIDPQDLRGRFRWWGLYTQRKPGIATNVIMASVSVIMT